MRHLLVPLGVLLLVLLAQRAQATEEVFVLDNGSVFRGHVVQDGEEQIEVKLSGFGPEARVHIEKARIVSRFQSMAERVEEKKPEPTPFKDWSADAHRVDEEKEKAAQAAAAQQLPAEEPSVRDEGFFHRLARVAVISLPDGVSGRTALALLLFVALLALVALGCRLAEVEHMGLGRMTILATLLGIFLVADIWFHETLLRADRATWVLPVQGIVWLVTALLVLRCGMSRAILLFAFVLFSLAVMMFSAGAILVTF